MYIGTTDGLGKYDTFLDNASVYRFRYFSPALTFGDPSKTKIVKKIKPTLIGANEETIFVKWAYDFETTFTNYEISVGNQVSAFYGVSEYTVGTFTGGILGLNSPLGATRKASIFHDQLHGRYGFHRVPSVDRIGDDPLPQGLAGNSAYIIRPWAAKKVLEKVAEVGMWPNDAIMCKQFFPWMQTCWPYFTAIQKGTISTTTG